MANTQDRIEGAPTETLRGFLGDELMSLETVERVDRYIENVRGEMLPIGLPHPSLVSSRGSVFGTTAIEDVTPKIDELLAAW